MIITSLCTTRFRHLMRNLLTRRNNWDIEDISFSNIGYLIKRLIHFFPALSEIEFLIRGPKQDDQWTFQSFCPEETDREREFEWIRSLKWLKIMCFLKRLFPPWPVLGNNLLNATNITTVFSSMTDHCSSVSKSVKLFLTCFGRVVEPFVIYFPPVIY